VGYLTTTDMLYILYLLLLMVIFILQMVLSLYTIKGPHGSTIQAEYMTAVQRTHDVIFVACVAGCIGYSAYVLVW
jgi:hypothetical protein